MLWCIVSINGTMHTSWRWDVASRRYLLTTWSGSTSRAALIRRLLLRRKVFTATGKRRRFPPTYRPTFRARYMFGIRIPTKPKRGGYATAFKSVVSSASFWQTWRGSRLKSCPHLWVRSHREAVSYLVLMSPLLSRIPRPNALRLWSSSVKRLHTKGS